MPRNLAVALLLAMPVMALAVEDEVRVPTTPDAKPHYEWITLLSEGPAAWQPAESKSPVRGRHFRIVFYQGPEEMPSSFRVEEVTFGEEGCCRKLLRARRFELEDALKKLGPFSVNAPTFEFVRWMSPSSFEFRYRGSTFLLSNLDRLVLTVKRASGG